GLPAGWYTLLPGHYALLPGAYRVTLAGSAGNVPPNLSVAEPDGSYLIAGKYGVAGTGVQDSLASMFRVMPGNVVRSYSEYDEYQGSSFFAQYALDNDKAIPRLAVDAGQVILQATRALTLQGAIDFAPGANGRGGLLDIAADSIAVIGENEAP